MKLLGKLILLQCLMVSACSNYELRDHNNNSVIETASENGIAEKSTYATNTYLDGAFLYFGDKNFNQIPLAQIDSFLDELLQLGIKEFAVTSVKQKYGTCTTGTFDWNVEFPGKLTTLLNAAADRGMGVYIGLVSSSAACPEFDNVTNASQVKDDTDLVMQALASYNDYPAMRGWYIPDEPGLGWSRFYNYTRDIVNVIRTYSTLPIAVSPFFAGASTNNTPSNVATMALDFKNNTGVDIQIWQDSMGVSGPMDLGWNRPGSKGSLETYYAAISQKLSKAGLWATLELFNCCVAPFDGVSYTPAAIARLHNQLKAANKTKVGKRFVWLQQYHMGTLDAGRKQEAPRLKASYRALAGIDGQLLVPVSYSWSLNQPAPQYPDTNTAELFDGKTSDPLNYAHAGWVGVNGNSAISIDFGAAKTLKWIGVHVLNIEANGVKFPQTMSLHSSTDGTNWNLVQTIPFPYTRRDSEYVFGNLTALNSQARYFKITFSNDSWTFVSEVEMVGQ